MIITTPAIIVAVRAHGEHGAIVRALTPKDGLQAGYVRGGRSRRLRPVLVPGNLVQAEFRARVEEQLAAATVELTRSRAPLLSEPLPAAAIEWVTALVAAALPEGQPFPSLHDGLGGVLDAIEHAPSARGWTGGLVRFEQLVLAELGYGAVPGDDLRANGRALEAHLFAGRRIDVMAARERLVERLNRSLPPGSA
ncbi:DNA repair protein RecO [Sphingomonas changbaiensis NBRC 104936]|uniref:DNA repair protein RecO n=1 Tax=Sphingomonas changbaiensis NBRC 104936 TaxID=1219043 RepID=A0A0E9MMP5_9SPHN|nr:recombination protein O N-terminal domain-containing protein [Sphingomonas changbaiensis]GAO38696.1 DNA repair protein RecO [Sphingomonas changbaiensis NBRC 104936]